MPGAKSNLSFNKCIYHIFPIDETMSMKPIQTPFLSIKSREDSDYPPGGNLDTNVEKVDSNH